MGFGLGIGLLLAYGVAEALLGAQQGMMLALRSLFFAVSLEPAVAGVMRFGVRRGVAVAVVATGVLGMVAGFIALAVPPVTTQIDALVKEVPVWLQQVHDHHSTLGRLEDRYHVVEKVKQHFSASDAGTTLFSGALGMGRRLVGALAGLLAVTTLTIYLLTGMPVIKRFALRFVRAPRREAVGILTDRIMTQVGRYMLANVATSVLAGLATFLWAWPFGIPYPALLGVFVAIMDLVPIIGSTVGGIVVSLVALAVSVPVAAATAVFYTVFRFTEDHLVNPLTMKFVVRIHPAATMLAVLVGGTLMGIVGAFVAVPAATAIGLILEEAVFPAREAAERGEALDPLEAPGPLELSEPPPHDAPEPPRDAPEAPLEAPVAVSSPGPDRASRPEWVRPPRTES
jgi:predicted PurR-regulated permease PerM